MRRIIITIICFFPILCFAQSISDYLILQDIGPYKLFTGITGRAFSGPPKQYSQTSTGGIVDAADHFSENDISYDASYTEPNSKWPFVKVEVTQHSGGDSNKWLQHEVERGFKDIDTLDATYVSPNPLRVINNQKIFYTWGYYRWISNYVVVSIQFTDLTGTKPEPLEVVQAYLQKFPSTIPTSLTLDNAHKIQWIKDEMDRRLWLCDKWFVQVTLGKTDQKTALQQVVGSMQVFLNYREKYYGIKAADDKNLLTGYLSANDGTNIKAKLTEYKNWWAVNKEKAISL